MSWTDEKFWPAFKRAGMLEPIDVLLPGCTELTRGVFVSWAEPDFDALGNQSKQYEIEYQFADMPALAEGCQVVRRGVRYEVRQPPFVPADDLEANNGFFRHAVLTRSK